jgi:hypothetical protein
VLIVPERATAIVILTNGANGPSIAEPVVRWLIERRLGLSFDAPTFPEHGPDLSALNGTYHAVSRAIQMRSGTTATIVAEVNDTGPTWAGTRVSQMRSAEGDRLVGVDDSTFRMEFGTVDNGPRWLRYRGRIHVPNT